MIRRQLPGVNGPSAGGRNGHRGAAGFPYADGPDADLLLPRARVPLGFRLAGVACGLKARGRGDVANLEGGFAAWRQAGYLIEVKPPVAA